MQSTLSAFFTRVDRENELQAKHVKTSRAQVVCMLNLITCMHSLSCQDMCSMKIACSLNDQLIEDTSPAAELKSLVQHGNCSRTIKANKYPATQEMERSRVIRQTRSLRADDEPWSDMITEDDTLAQVNLLMHQANHVRLYFIVNVNDPQLQLGCHSKSAGCMPAYSWPA